jgi:hypothetical protein
VLLLNQEMPFFNNLLEELLIFVEYFDEFERYNTINKEKTF